MNAVKKPHKHAEVIRAYADGETIEHFDRNVTDKWQVIHNPAFYECEQYRVKPREFPKSTLPYQTLCDIWNAQNNMPSGEGIATRALRVCADMAVKRYIMDLEEAAAKGA